MRLVSEESCQQPSLLWIFGLGVENNKEKGASDPLLRFSQPLAGDDFLQYGGDTEVLSYLNVFSVQSFVHTLSIFIASRTSDPSSGARFSSPPFSLRHIPVCTSFACSFALVRIWPAYGFGYPQLTHFRLLYSVA